MKTGAAQIALCTALAFAIALPLALAEVSDGGATVSVQVADGGDTTVSVTRGLVKLRAAGKETHVRAGQGATIRRGHAAKKMSLLPAPDELKPADGTRLPNIDVTVKWAKVRGAYSYHVAIASDPRFARTIHDSTLVDGDQVQVKLQAGIYYWRVSAVDKEGLEGRSSPTLRLVVDTTPPRLKTGPPKWQR